MKGFKININEESVKIGGEFEGVTSIAINYIKKRGEEQVHISASGIDSENDIRKEWIHKVLKENDRITIDVLSDLIVDEPQKQYSIDNQMKELLQDQKLREYKKLKKELEEEGLI